MNKIEKLLVEEAKKKSGQFKNGDLVVNGDGWFGKVVNAETGFESTICRGCKMIEVEVLGYSKLLDRFKSPEVPTGEMRFAYMEKYYPIGKIVSCNEFNFKPYPEYIGIWCNEWVKE